MTSPPKNHINHDLGHNTSAADSIIKAAEQTKASSSPLAYPQCTDSSYYPFPLHSTYPDTLWPHH
jgi:hypothetical protein